MQFENILIVGCGNMAGGMLEGWLAAGLDPARFTIASPSEKPFAVTQHRSIPESGQFDAILLGVKPQKLGEVAPRQSSRIAGAQTTVLSLLAGIDLDTLAGTFPARRRGCPGHAQPRRRDRQVAHRACRARAGRGRASGADRLMQPLGTPEWVAEEAFDLVTALAGSGPASASASSTRWPPAPPRLGLPREQADRLALAMVEGAAALAAASPYDPGELARRVASPGA